MRKIDNITYPDGDEDLLKHPKLGKMYYKFLKKRVAEESADFLLSVAKGRDPKKQYPIFFDPKSRTQINVSSTELLKAKELSEKQDWKSKEWKKVYDESISQLRNLLTQNFELAFYQTKEFKAFHERALRKVVKIPAKLKEQLQMEDESLLADTVVLFMSDKKRGKKAAQAIEKKKKSPRNAKQIGTAIMKCFKIR